MNRGRLLFKQTQNRGSVGKRFAFVFGPTVSRRFGSRSRLEKFTTRLSFVFAHQPNFFDDETTIENRIKPQTKQKRDAPSPSSTPTIVHSAIYKYSLVQAMASPLRPAVGLAARLRAFLPATERCSTRRLVASAGCFHQGQLLQFVDRSSHRVAAGWLSSTRPAVRLSSSSSASGRCISTSRTRASSSTSATSDEDGTGTSHDPHQQPSRKITTRPLIEARKGPSFKVSRVSYDGAMETVTLGTTELLKTASIFARDLFFTLNLTSRQERQQQGMTNRRSVSAIQPRNDVIVLSFGKVRAVVGHTNVLIFDAHSPAVRQFAQELRNVYKSGNLNGEPNELVFLEYVLRDTVDSYNRRLRLFEPIGTL